MPSSTNTPVKSDAPAASHSGAATTVASDIDVAPAGRRTGSPIETPPSSADRASQLILVVDDQVFFLARWKKCLEQHGFAFAGTSNGLDAVKMAATLQPDVILLDVMMPEMDGYETCAAIKDAQSTCDIPVIFLTAESETNQKVRGFEVGGADYVSKAADEAELIARVRTHQKIADLQRRLKKSHEALEAQLHEVQEHIEKEREMADRIQSQRSQLIQADKMASIGKLAAGVAHEINNPIGFVSSNLNSLGNYLDDIKKFVHAHGELLGMCAEHAELEPEVRRIQQMRKDKDIDYILDDLDDLINESVDGTERVRKIVADMRDFSHVDRPDIAEESINELLDKTLAVANNELKYKTEIIRHYDDIPPLMCFGGKLGQVFLNLLVNAAHAIEDHGSITISTTIEGKMVVVEFADTGQGIPAEELPRIFEPFYTTKDVGEGTGLGLHLSKSIMKAHGGAIKARSVVGEGTTMRVEIPLSGPPKQEGDEQ